MTKTILMAAVLVGCTVDPHTLVTCDQDWAATGLPAPGGCAAACESRVELGESKGSCVVVLLEVLGVERRGECGPTYVEFGGARGCCIHTTSDNEPAVVEFRECE